jgi:AcrR family transcriptional regulator
VADTVVGSRTLIIDAARSRLLADGYAGLSTRKVAEEAGVPLSQLHYHFGSKGGPASPGLAASTRIMVAGPRRRATPRARP